MLISIIILSIVIFILLLAIRNLLVKVEKYEDVTVDQTEYLQNISNVIRDSQKYLNSLDEKGIFQSDDEVGYFFEQLKNVQKELDRYMLPENYGEKEIEK
jgi:type II secretory pathway pseudopilin PulG|tara:strand:- start:560 stop:859 length:300 start_codon:yes stop_codon:yes gene_type:complete